MKSCVKHLSTDSFNALYLLQAALETDMHAIQLRDRLLYYNAHRWMLEYLPKWRTSRLYKGSKTLIMTIHDTSKDANKVIEDLYIGVQNPVPESKQGFAINAHIAAIPRPFAVLIEWANDNRNRPMFEALIDLEKRYDPLEQLEVSRGRSRALQQYHGGSQQTVRTT